MSGK
jgi:hypothetical protein